VNDDNNLAVQRLEFCPGSFCSLRIPGHQIASAIMVIPERSCYMPKDHQEAFQSRSSMEGSKPTMEVA